MLKKNRTDPKFLNGSVCCIIITKINNKCFKFVRFPPQSPLKPVPMRPLVRDHGSVPRIPRWDDYEDITVPEKIPMKPLMVREHCLWMRYHLKNLFFLVLFTMLNLLVV